jgi:tRNA threonylcarbamoyl adenosine modification protein YeaZ
MNKPLVLGIETSGIRCSVAWQQDNQTKLVYNVSEKNAHATLLANLIARGFKEIQVDPAETSLVAIATGPGSFTGLRIGLAYAKGFCMGLNVPLTAISNFEILADMAASDRTPIYTLIEARNDYCYAGIFPINKYELKDKYVARLSDLNKNIPANAQIIVHEEREKGKFAQTLSGRDLIIAETYSAEIICSLGISKQQNDEPAALNDIEPLYLQPFAGVL